MRSEQPQAVHLEQYRPPQFAVDRLHLTFELDSEATLVTARSHWRRLEPDAPLALNGEHLELVSVAIDGVALAEGDYQLDDRLLTLHPASDEFDLTVVTRLNPADNTALEGLYQSSGNFCTQCEAEGFRRITYYLDRPDVLTTFTTRIEADRSQCPVLLSNGNPVEQGELENGRHYAEWHDPHPKPSYLFALVAGQLSAITDHFTTDDGREVELRVYVEEHNLDKCDHAMASLKKAMLWDEERFGLTYDLDIYMIVAVDDFNMGAMENKGLNLFNSKFVLARPDTATDTDYLNIESVIGHEYFHNWTGNRVTCRDWFQLSLKEGLTVFRDQEFSADAGARAIKRIDDVRMLRTAQFAEDAGPMAHPVRPDHYIEINNFYTLTIYEKGAEVIRMQHTLLGEDGFQKGLKLYFERHDGQAVTCEDFLAAMADANARKLDQFHRWYTQAGTPVLEVRDHYDPEARQYRLDIRQYTPDTPGQTDKLPLHIPLALALLDGEGRLLPLNDRGDSSGVFDITESEQSLTFDQVNERPTPSLLRGFSAPVKLDYPYSRDQLAFLAAHDDDAFNRWEASQRLQLDIVHALLEDHAAGRELTLPAQLVEVFDQTLYEGGDDKSLIAAALTLPSERYIAETVDVVDPEAIHTVREFVAAELARSLRKAWLEHYHENNAQDRYRIDPDDIAERRLKNLCLSYLMRLSRNDSFELCLSQAQDSDNMTDRLAALALLCEEPGAVRDEVLAGFYRQFEDDPQVLDKWFALQAASSAEDTPQRVRELMQHDKFTLRTPNRLRALIGTFYMANPLHFHQPDGANYQLLADVVLELDRINPQVAARMVSAFNGYARLESGRRQAMYQQIKRIHAHDELSSDVYEVVDLALKADQAH
ncbi:MAG: aminopeptidase N [Pseudomonadota bacterium]